MNSQTSIYVRTITYSKRYVRDDDLILSLIEDPINQLSLCLSENVIPTGLSLPRANKLQLMNERSYKSLYELSVHRFFQYPLDIVKLIWAEPLISFPQDSFPKTSFLQELTEFCQLLVDLSSCSNLRKIYLKDCWCLSDISPLKNVPDITLINCQRITDFTILGNQVRLSLTNCPNVRNLSKVKYLIT